MKRTFLLFAFAFLLASTSFAQTDKGWRSVGGSGIIRMDFKNSAFTFGLTPELYWFVGNSFALGTDFGFGFSSRTDSSYSTNSFNAYIAPGARFYFRDPEKKWRPYAFVNAGFETYADHTKFNSVTTNSTGSGFLGYAGAGLAWFFNEHAAFDMRLHVIDFSRNTAAFNPTFTIGIQAFFHHE